MPGIIRYSAFWHWHPVTPGIIHYSAFWYSHPVTPGIIHYSAFWYSHPVIPGIIHYSTCWHSHPVMPDNPSTSPLSNPQFSSFRLFTVSSWTQLSWPIIQHVPSGGSLNTLASSCLVDLSASFVATGHTTKSYSISVISSYSLT